jgi:hypothetical protein
MGDQNSLDKGRSIVILSYRKMCWLKVRCAPGKDLAKIDAAAHPYNLTVVESNVSRRTVGPAGTTAELGQAYRVQLQKHKSREVTSRERRGRVCVASELVKVVEGVFGPDNLFVAQPPCDTSLVVCRNFFLCVHQDLWTGSASLKCPSTGKGTWQEWGKRGSLRLVAVAEWHL